MKILVGADPEVFVRQGGEFVSAHGLIKGDKKHPLPVRNGAVQVDGMALEFNIEPASSEEEFLFNVSDVMGQLKAMVPEYEVVATPVAHFGAEYIESQPEEAKLLGCDPDFNAWSSKENQPPNAELPFRTAAGHIHIGWTEDAEGHAHLSMVEELVKQLDFFLALPSLLYDGDVERRRMYGKAGAYRPKGYGCEYRTLSNKWLTDNKLMSLVYRNTQQAIKRLISGEKLSDRYGNIEGIINNSSELNAKAIMDAEGIAYEV